MTYPIRKLIEIANDFVWHDREWAPKFRLIKKTLQHWLRQSAHQ